MASVIKNKSGRWEIRESRNTPKGPRSKTLATFGKLDHFHLELAASCADGEFDFEAVRRAARRAGAPVDPAPADAAAIKLLRAIGDGESLNPRLKRLLVDALKTSNRRPLTDETLEHIGMTSEARGADLIDLLLLADEFPDSEDDSPLRFPVMPAARG